jgi:hypothetical protein
MSNRIFISYRRDDFADAIRINDCLGLSFGLRNVLMDTFGLRPSREMTSVEEELAQCTLLLAVIGPTWLKAGDKSDFMRLHDPDDLVRRQIAGALARDIAVIPVLVGGAAPPTKGELPEDIQGMLNQKPAAVTTLDDMHFLLWYVNQIRPTRRPAWRQKLLISLKEIAKPVASIASFAPAQSPLKYPFESDRDALAHDWEVVGRELGRSLMSEQLAEQY